MIIRPTTPLTLTSPVTAGKSEVSFWEHELIDIEPAQFSFEPKSVFVIMAFKGEGMQDVYKAIKEECANLGFDAKRVDENIGRGGSGH